SRPARTRPGGSTTREVGSCPEASCQLGLGEAVGEGLAEGEGVGEGVGEAEGDGEGEGEGDGGFFGPTRSLIVAPWSRLSPGTGSWASTTAPGNVLAPSTSTWNP